MCIGSFSFIEDLRARFRHRQASVRVTESAPPQPRNCGVFDVSRGGCSMNGRSARPAVHFWVANWWSRAGRVVAADCVRLNRVSAR
jgi:hypothetical protein